MISLHEDTPPVRTVEGVIITDQLAGRLCRPPDLGRESRALRRLSRALSGSPENLLKNAVKEAQALCGADAAGLSLVTKEAPDRLRWVGLTGSYAALNGNTVARDFSPCGLCLQRRRSELFQRPQRFFPELAGARPAIEEVLVVPIFSGRRPLGTFWLVSNSKEKRFDEEDRKTLDRFAAFVGSALRAAQRQAKLAESESFSRGVLSGSVDCIKVLDAEGLLTFLNKAGCKLLGIRRAEEMIGRRWIGFWSDAEQEKARAALKIADAGGIGRFEGFRPNALGASKWWDVTVTRMRGGQGTHLVVSRDITSLKLTEKALREVNASLEERVRERTSELAKAHGRQVVLARKLLESTGLERRRLASELHDEMGQQLTALKLSIENLAADLPGGGEARVAGCLALLRTVMEQVRTVSFDLRQSLPDHIPLHAALDSHFKKLKAQHGFEVRFKCRKGQRFGAMPPEIARAALRVVQESLTNVIRHAGVAKADVKLALRSNHLALEVADRGRGFDRDQASGRIQNRTGQNRTGLAGMEERVLLLGGRLEVTTALGAGTRLNAILPLALNEI